MTATAPFVRAWSLDDIKVRTDMKGSDGKTGRVVEASR